jgi:archaellum component FlaF (FlaF/FlaG flagellin family)
VVTDILSDSLKYAENAIVIFPDGTTMPMEPVIVDGTYVWKFPDLVLVPCQTITIEFDAEVVKCGVDVNTQRVTAVCAEEPGLLVSDEDT